MKIKILLLLMITTICISGCLDHWYPNDLSGTINNGIYTNHTRTGKLPSFDTYSVMVPQHFNEYQTPMLVANEKIANDYTYTIFGPAITDHTVYRTMVFRKNYQPMSVVEDAYFRAFMNTVDKDINRQWKQIYHTTTTVNGHPATYYVYANSEPDVYNYISKHQPGNVDVTNAIYFVDYGKYGVILWMKYHSDSAVNQVIPNDRPLIIRQAFKPQQSFIRSFHINEYRGRCC